MPIAQLWSNGLDHLRVTLVTPDTSRLTARDLVKAEHFAKAILVQDIPDQIPNIPR